MEELLAQFVIPLEPKTKKNSHRISGCGARCPVCGKYKRQFIRNARRTIDYAYQATRYLHPRPEAAIGGEVHLIYRVYTKTRRRVDDLNLYENTDDILVESGILEDDNRSIIRSRDGSRVLYDKEHPRTEIYILRYHEEEDPWLTEQNFLPATDSSD